MPKLYLDANKTCTSYQKKCPTRDEYKFFGENTPTSNKKDQKLIIKTI